MLEQIVLNNFLFFDNYQHFNLKRINLLTGLNNTGKTNFLKSILLIRQSLPSLFKNNELTLNSKIIKFGTFNDHFKMATFFALWLGFLNCQRIS